VKQLEDVSLLQIVELKISSGILLIYTYNLHCLRQFSQGVLFCYVDFRLGIAHHESPNSCPNPTAINTVTTKNTYPLHCWLLPVFVCVSLNAEWKGTWWCFACLNVADQNKDKALNWENRYKIIIGTAEGLVYFHMNSKIRIIHRDTKASNIC